MKYKSRENGLKRARTEYVIDRCSKSVLGVNQKKNQITKTVIIFRDILQCFLLSEKVVSDIKTGNFVIRHFKQRQVTYVSSSRPIRKHVAFVQIIITTIH